MDSLQDVRAESRFREAIITLSDFLPNKSVSLRNSTSVSEAVELLLKLRKSRMAKFRTHLFGDPAWDIVLDLYLNESRGTRVSVSSACIASETSPTTGLRYVRALEQEKIIERVADKKDGRRFYLNLTDRGRLALRAVVLENLGPSHAMSNGP